MRDFNSVREEAARTAAIDLDGLYFGDSSRILDEQFLETENCWMLFQRSDISFPPGRELSQGAYVFSKHSNESRFVPDFRKDQPQLLSFLKSISDYFAKPVRHSSARE
jgi:hypothetical protein